MDVLTRSITRQRSETFSQTFKFTTLSIIFSKLPPKEEEYTNFQKLIRWIRFAFMVGLPENQEPYESCSSATVPVAKSIEPLLGDDNPFMELMQGCNYRGTSNYQHQMVEDFLMRNDKNAICAELPLWIEVDRSPNKKPWLGFCDLVRALPDQTIMLCDFKPDVSRIDQKRAASQMSRYIVMLNICTKIPMKSIKGVLFDEKAAFLVTP